MFKGLRKSGLKWTGVMLLLMIMFTGAIQAGQFSRSDLEGTWYFHSIALDSTTGMSMARGTVVFDETGVITGGSYAVMGDLSNVANYTFGQFNVNPDGEVSGSLSDSLGYSGNIHAGKMNEAKTIFTTISYSTSIEYSFEIWTRAGGSFSTADLAGTWNCDAIIYGTGLGTGAMTASGTVQFDASGENKNAQFTLSDDSTYNYQGGSFNVSGSGLMAGSATDGAYTFTMDYGKMAPSKSTFPAMAESDVGAGLEYFGVLTQSGGSFKQSNMAGDWYIGMFAREGGAQVCRYGKISVNSAGAITSGYVSTSTGNWVPGVHGNLYLSAAGTVSGYFDMGGRKTIGSGKMDKDKMIVHGLEKSGESGGMFYLVRYSEAVELGVSELNFSSILDGDAAGTQDIAVTSANGITAWSASSNSSWLEISPASGTGSGAITVSVNPEGLVPGKYIGTVTVEDAAGEQYVTVNYTIYSAGQTAVPFGQFDSPNEAAVHQGSIPVTGWALDDVGIESLEIKLETDGVLNTIGEAVFIQGARPDVEQAYPGYPYNYKAGWGYMLLTNYLPNSGNGTFTLHAVATDLEGNTANLGQKTITCNNANAVKPFGAIDTPAQGGTASGDAFVNFGWVLTPQPNKIPEDGSTIRVLVDGVNVGSPVYNEFRGDIATFFPGYANTGGASGYFILDTTAYDNGLHSIQWTATDSAGNTDGIGSRYFMIQNTNESERNHGRAGTTDSTAKPADDEAYDVSPGTLALKKGFEAHAGYRVIQPGKDGVFHMVCSELEPLEIRLPSGSSREGKHAARFIARQLVGINERPLPVGSTFDPVSGVLYWQPGFGFIGTYRLVFTVEGANREPATIQLLVTIVPKSLGDAVDRGLMK